MAGNKTVAETSMVAQAQGHGSEGGAVGNPDSGGPVKPGRKKKRMVTLLLILLIPAVGYGIYWEQVDRFHRRTDDAYVEGDMIRIGAQVPGTVVAVNAAMTQYVERGAEVVRLDDTDARIALAQAQADLAQAVRNAIQLFHLADASRAKVAELRMRLSQAREDLDRNRGLLRVGGISSEALRHLETRFGEDNAAYEQALHQLGAAEAAVVKTSIERHPLILQAEARVRSAWTALNRTRVLAPVSGYVAQKQAEVGQQTSPSAVLLSITPLQNVYVAANFKESQINDIRLGQPVTLRSDLYGSDMVYHGRVVGFASGTGAALSVLPPQNASGNWIKVVQRLPIRIALDPEELVRHPLMLGLSMTADVDIRGQNGGILSRTPVFEGASSTDVYAGQSDGVESDIARIVRDNLPPGSAVPEGSAWRQVEQLSTTASGPAASGVK